jgi:DNA gyrase subunit A
LSEYPVIRRAGRGVIDIKTTTGKVVCMKAVGEDDEVLLVTNQKIVRTPISDVRIIGRNTKGVRIVNLEKEDYVLRVEKIARDEEVEVVDDDDDE